jgi:hypothetical protein
MLACQSQVLIPEVLMYVARTLVLVATFSACAGAAYQAPEVSVWRIPAGTLLQAAQEVARDRGWRPVALTHKTFVAVSRPQPLAGVLARARWTFDVVAGGLTVRRLMEVQWDANEPWVSSTTVCEDYQYLTEQQVVEAVHHRLSAEPPRPPGNVRVTAAH